LRAGRLVSPTGMSLYYNGAETVPNATPKCAGACSNAWRPLESLLFNERAGAGVTCQLGHVARVDGIDQVTCQGRALYMWQGDKAPGDTTGNGVSGFVLATP